MLCKEYLPGLVYLVKSAGLVIEEHNEPLELVHQLLLHRLGSSRKRAEDMGDHRKCSPDVPG